MEDRRAFIEEVAQSASTDFAPLRRRLLRKYVTLFVAVVCAALLASGAMGLWFSYQDHKSLLLRLQREQATGAAARIGQFIRDIEGHLGWTTQLAWGTTSSEQRRFDALRLLRQVPAITEVAQIDPQGKEQLKVSRLAMDVVGGGADRTADPRFLEALANRVSYSPVYFRRESEPYMTIAIGGNRRDSGVSVAEVNLKLIWDLISAIRVGEKGLAYVVNSSGRLVAHPDISLVLRNTSLARLTHVDAARTQPDAPVQESRDATGHNVLTAFARVPSTGWLVFAESPIEEAYASLYHAVRRSLLILLAALSLAAVTGYLLARKMVVPIRSLIASAASIGRGNLDQQIKITTGDELKSLADEFNNMSARLRESYADLEGKVRQRTRELAEKSDQLELASLHKSHFLANMSHELRTPLNAILGYTELLSDGIYGELPDKPRAVLERVLENGKHLLALINDVLDLSKIEAGELSLTIEDYVPSSIVHSVVAATGSLAQKKGLILKTTVEDDLPIGRGDARRISQALLNLVGNAIKFTDSGKVEVGARAADGKFSISVCDTGPGITKEDQARIFEEFRQVDSSSTREKGGSGLGLAIAKRFVEMHGGNLEVQSAPGEGSTFTITIPIRGLLPEDKS